MLPEVRRVHQHKSQLTVGVNGYHLLTGFTVLSKAMRDNSHHWSFAFNHMLVMFLHPGLKSRHFL